MSGRTDLWTLAVIVGLAGVTVLTRCFFFILDRPWVLPGWAERALQYAPVAALAGVVAPELAKLEQQRESLRYERQERMIISLRDAGALRPDLDYATARDIFWMLTGRDVYRMLVRERGWTSQKYQDWLADTLVRNLLTIGRVTAVRGGAPRRHVAKTGGRSS
jgi:branched-subunit amino acid transport protein